MVLNRTFNCRTTRSWSSGYDRRLPSDGPGFNSRRTQYFLPTFLTLPSTLTWIHVNAFILLPPRLELKEIRPQFAKKFILLPVNLPKNHPRLKLGQTCPLRALGVLGQDEAIRCFMRFPPLVNDSGVQSAPTDGENVVLRYRHGRPEGTPFSLGSGPPPHYRAVLEPR